MNVFSCALMPETVTPTYQEMAAFVRRVREGGVEGLVRLESLVGVQLAIARFERKRFADRESLPRARPRSRQAQLFE